MGSTNNVSRVTRNPLLQRKGPWLVRRQSNTPKRAAIDNASYHDATKLRPQATTNSKGMTTFSSLCRSIPDLPLLQQQEGYLHLGASQEYVRFSTVDSFSIQYPRPYIVAIPFGCPAMVLSLQ